MESPAVFIFFQIILSLTTDVFGQQIYASRNPVPVGSDVTLFSTSNNSAGAWLFEGRVIVVILPGIPILDQDWKDRIVFNDTTLALTLHSVQLTDSGEYTLSLVDTFNGALKLSVQVPVTNTTLVADETELVEFNDTAVLRCSVSNGTSLEYEWLHNSSVIGAGGRVQISDGGSTLMIVNVTRSDIGPYECKVSNNISQGMSSAVRLSVSYGPSSASMYIMPEEHTYRTGSNITLACFASSYPTATVQWMVNEMNLNHPNEELQLLKVKEENSGNYKCVFHNTVTSRFSSASAMIRILGPVAAVMVNDSGDLAIENKSFSLTCEVQGSFAQVDWWRNGSPVYADNTTYMSDKTLTLNPVQVTDVGDYRCRASSAVSNMTSAPYKLVVNYGPDTPVIDGPSFAETGQNAVFECSALSVPPSKFSWCFNGTRIASSPQLTTESLFVNMSGEYTCMASNEVTGLNSTTSKKLTVIERIRSVTLTNQTVPINGKNFSLACDVVGPYDAIYWMKDNVSLGMNSSDPQVSDDTNNTLLFRTLTLWHDGKYQCVATNKVRHHQSPSYHLLVNYGPLNMSVTGPDSAKEGSTVSMTCSAESRPDSDFSWFLDNKPTIPGNEPTFTFTASKLTEGNYSCQARNHVTNMSMMRSKTFTLSGVASVSHFTTHKLVMLLGLMSSYFTLLLS